MNAATEIYLTYTIVYVPGILLFAMVLYYFNKIDKLKARIKYYEKDINKTKDTLSDGNQKNSENGSNEGIDAIEKEVTLKSKRINFYSTFAFLIIFTILYFSNLPHIGDTLNNSEYYSDAEKNLDYEKKYKNLCRENSLLNDSLKNVYNKMSSYSINLKNQFDREVILNSDLNKRNQSIIDSLLNEKNDNDKMHTRIDSQKNEFNKIKGDLEDLTERNIKTLKVLELTKDSLQSVRDINDKYINDWYCVRYMLYNLKNKYHFKESEMDSLKNEYKKKNN